MPHRLLQRGVQFWRTLLRWACYDAGGQPLFDKVHARAPFIGLGDAVEATMWEMASPFDGGKVVAFVPEKARLTFIGSDPLATNLAFASERLRRCVMEAVEKRMLCGSSPTRFSEALFKRTEDLTLECDEAKTKMWDTLFQTALPHYFEGLSFGWRPLFDST